MKFNQQTFGKCLAYDELSITIVVENAMVLKTHFFWERKYLCLGTGKKLLQNMFLGSGLAVNIARLVFHSKLVNILCF